MRPIDYIIYPFWVAMVIFIMYILPVILKPIEMIRGEDEAED